MNKVKKVTTVSVSVLLILLVVGTAAALLLAWPKVGRVDREAIEAFRSTRQVILESPSIGEFDLPASVSRVAVNGKIKVVGEDGERVAIIYHFFGRGENFIGYLWDVDGKLKTKFDSSSYPGYVFVKIDNRVAYIDADLGDGIYAVSRMED